MFGLIKPCKSMLSQEDSVRYQNLYCGLCHTLSKRYGKLHSWFLSYDMVFLALLLEKQGDAQQTTFRCPLHPFRVCAYTDPQDVLAFVADVSVLLTYYKVEDNLQDEAGREKSKAWLFQKLLARGYRKAKQYQPEIDALWRIDLQRLHYLEQAQSPSIDQTADAFASMLTRLVLNDGTAPKRIQAQMLYHIGRWIYLMDAYQDLADDFAKGRYNPLIFRYALETPDMTAYREPFLQTVLKSVHMIQTSFFLDITKQGDTLLCHFLLQVIPSMTQNVLTLEDLPKE